MHVFHPCVSVAFCLLKSRTVACTASGQSLCDHVAEEAKAHGQHARGPGRRRNGNTSGFSPCESSVLQAKTECKSIKGKKLGSAFWMGVRNLHADADLVTPDLQVKDMGQVVSETLVKALDQARTANCTKRSQAAFISWLQTAEAVNQKEFVGIAKHALTLKVNSNQAQPRALNQYHTQSNKQTELTTQVYLILPAL